MDPYVLVGLTWLADNVKLFILASVACRWVRGSGLASILHYSYLSVSTGSKRAAFNAGYILNKTPHVTEKEIMIIMLLTSITVGISLK